MDSSFEGFTYINGKFAGAEGDTKVKLDLSATTSGLAVDGFGDLSFSDLEFVSGGGMMVGYVNYYTSLHAYGTDVLFSNVTTSTQEGGYVGDIGCQGTNQSPFVSQVFYSNFTMEDCINGANIYCRYGSAFIGGYAQYSTINFTNCVNYGYIHADSAAMLIGNSSRYTDDNTFNITNCINEGTIYGMARAGLYVGVGGAAYDDDYDTEQLTNNGTVRTTTNEMEVTINKDGTISATYTNDTQYTVASAKVWISSYLVTKKFGATTASTLLVYYAQGDAVTDAEGKTVSSDFKAYDVVDWRTEGVENLRPAEGASVSGIMLGELDGETVYYIPKDFETSAFPLTSFEPFQVNATQTKITPTIMFYLYDANGVVVDIVTFNLNS